MRALDKGLLKDTFAGFGADKASILAAAIAYTTVFAIAPLIIIAIAIAGEVLGLTNGGHGHHIVENQLIGAIGASAGQQTADMVRSIVDTSFRSRQGSVLAQTIGWATFILAASGLFLTLQSALNTVWHVEPKEHGIWLTLRNRLASAVMLLAIGALLLATMALNVVISFVWAHFTQLLPFPGAGLVAALVNYAVNIVVLSVMFALMYKVLPDTEVAWVDVRAGAIATAVLFVIGEALLSVYISRAGISNGYGAVGSLVVLLVWVYYSAMLLLLGAEYTRAYAERHGSRAGTGSTSDGKVPVQRGETAPRGTTVTSA